MQVKSITQEEVIQLQQYAISGGIFAEAACFRAPNVASKGNGLQAITCAKEVQLHYKALHVSGLCSITQSWATTAHTGMRICVSCCKPKANMVAGTRSCATCRDATWDALYPIMLPNM